MLQRLPFLSVQREDINSQAFRESGEVFHGLAWLSVPRKGTKNIRHGQYSNASRITLQRSNHGTFTFCSNVKVRMGSDIGKSVFRVPTVHRRMTYSHTVPGRG